jgi:cell division protein ZapA
MNMNTVSDEFQIQLKIADQYYPLNCKRSEEGIIRKAASYINEKLLPEYRSFYSKADLDMKDFLAFVAFQVSLENLCVQKNEDLSPLFNKVAQLNKELEEYLSRKIN